jgi:hypothetical protein
MNITKCAVMYSLIGIEPIQFQTTNKLLINIGYTIAIGWRNGLVNMEVLGTADLCIYDLFIYLFKLLCV